MKQIIKNSHLKGLAEGEKIGKEKQWKATEKAQKKTSAKIKEFEKENEELKEQCLILADCDTCYSPCKNDNVEMKKQLIKAKEIIKDYMIISSNVTVCSVSEENRCINVLKLNEEAEKFIREIEL